MRLLPILLSIGIGLGGCGAEQGGPEVDLEAVRLSAAEAAEWPQPAIESGTPRVRVRQVFTAQGPCRVLDAELMRRFPGEYLLRVVAAEAQQPCADDTPHLGYTAELRGLSPGSYQLRIVHVGADGRTLAETVLEHPIVVTGEGGR